MCLVYTEKTIKTISYMLNVQARVVRARLRYLGSFGLILKKNRRYIIRPKDNDITQFLKNLRNFSKENGKLIWRFKDEMLIKVRNSNEIKGKLTGFNLYSDYGVPVHTVSYLCYIGKLKLSTKIIFVHSLREIEDPRTLALAIVFYVKNKLYKKASIEKIKTIAEKYDVLKQFLELGSTYVRYKFEKEEILDNIHLPKIDRKELKKQFELYGVKNV